MIWYTALVLVIGLERVAELVVSARNARWSFAHGGVESARGQVAPMVLLHIGLLVGCVSEVWFAQRPFIPWLGWPMFALVILANVVRWWCIRVLGHQWNTRVIVVPGLGAVRRGPYRLTWLKHPNYLVVAIEGFALPLVHTAWVTALCFTVLNAVFLFFFRIPAENRALAALADASDRTAAAEDPAQ